jgi:hypothetical protein
MVMRPASQYGDVAASAALASTRHLLPSVARLFGQCSPLVFSSGSRWLLGWLLTMRAHGAIRFEAMRRG